MKIVIHPKAIDSFDNKAEETARGIIQVPIIQRARPEFVPDFAIKAIIDADAAQKVIEENKDRGNITISRFLLTKDGKIGFNQEEYHNLQLLAEDIYERQEIHPNISLKKVEDEIFDWATERFLQRTASRLCEYIIPNLEDAISEVEIIIPIRHVSTQFTFPCGKMTFIPLNASFFDNWERDLAGHSILDVPEMKAKIVEYRQMFQGHSACTVRMVAEQRRAQEIALEEADIALALFRVFADPLLTPGVRSVCHHWRGQGDAQNGSFITNVTHNAPPLWNGHLAPASDPIILNQERLDIIFGSGFAKVQNVYLSESKTDFQKDLLKSLLIYSRSSLREDAADQLIYVFTALESFLLRNQNENIQQNIGERVAFIIGNTPSERIAIKYNIIAAYSIRSKAVHHGQSIRERDTIIEFFKNVFFFFVNMIDCNEKYKTRNDLFDEIEGKKFA